MRTVPKISDDHVRYWEESSLVPPSVVVMRAPPGMLDRVVDCSVVTTRNAAGDVEIHVPWEVEEADLERIAQGGVVWVTIVGGLPPHRLDAAPRTR